MLKLLTLILVILVDLARNEVYKSPEQIHLSLGESPNEMVVTWITQQNTNSTIVEYGEKEFDKFEKGSSIKFTDGGPERREFFNHRVVLRDLKPGTMYIYHCGSPDGGWSSVYFFRAIKDGSHWSPRFAIYGDMGNVNAQSLSRLQEEVQRGHFDAILHVGDFAYNLDTDDAKVGDAFMNQIQSIAAYVPYMTCAGNHEQNYNFSNYMSRFSMPKAQGDGHNMFFSFDIGPVHFISFSSEYYYFTKYGWNQIANQYRWLESDLKKANLPERRKKTPWIIAMFHRPLYCSNADDPEHCTNAENIIRIGFPFGEDYGIEKLLYKYGVDVAFQAHEHAYERMWPVYNLTVCNGSANNPYLNPSAPVHIVTGSAGCQEGVDPFLPLPNTWSAFHSDDYGYARMTVLNSSHLHIEQVSDDQNGKVIDSMTLIKNKHGAGTYNCHERNLKQTSPLKGPAKMKFT
ncbi:DgyrCDS2925 [Dimorphilus gyrociliatus]|uniref:Purple acid phosphatase n=1 Tax=Dimorphilus gyrociliatus TaxID=2664684 RepID=A0A7I8VEQ9_9ANNE|nr:DgyrCDS2925 [Dimorphilus gyrociliatus]